MNFNVGDKVFSKIYNKEGEIVYTDTEETDFPYLVGFKNLSGYTGDSVVSKDVVLEIERKGYLNKCRWCKEESLELIKEKKIIKNVDIIANDKKLNGIGMCQACYKIKNNMNCTGIYCEECEFFSLEDCYKFLAKEYKPKIKLTKMEHELLLIYDKMGFKQFCYVVALMELKEKEYFKDIDKNSYIKDILENCEVEEEK